MNKRLCPRSTSFFQELKANFQTPNLAFGDLTCYFLICVLETILSGEYGRTKNKSATIDRVVVTETLASHIVSY